MILSLDRSPVTEMRGPCGQFIASNSNLARNRHCSQDVTVFPKKGIFGKQASEAPAYIQNIVLLEIVCSRR